MLNTVPSKLSSPTLSQLVSGMFTNVTWSDLLQFWLICTIVGCLSIKAFAVLGLVSLQIEYEILRPAWRSLRRWKRGG